MKNDSRIITLRVLIFNYPKTNTSPPEFKTLVGGFEAVSVCGNTHRLIDVFDVATHDTDIFTRLCCWLNEQGRDSDIHASIENAGDPILDCDDYMKSWNNIMAQLPNFPASKLYAHQGLGTYDHSLTPEERARDMLAKIGRRETIGQTLARNLECEL